MASAALPASCWYTMDRDSDANVLPDCSTSRLCGPNFAMMGARTVGSTEASFSRAHQGVCLPMSDTAQCGAHTLTASSVSRSRHDGLNAGQVEHMTPLRMLAHASFVQM